MKHTYFFLLLLTLPHLMWGQQQLPPTSDDLKEAVLQLQDDVTLIQSNLAKADKKLKRGILVSTLGYSITIAGGLMLGGSNNDLGEVLLYTGGAVGVVGTITLVDAFKYLGFAGGKQKPQKE